MNKPKMPQANPKAMSKKGTRENKLILQLSVSDERFVIIVLVFVFEPANGGTKRWHEHAGIEGCTTPVVCKSHRLSPTYKNNK